MLPSFQLTSWRRALKVIAVLLLLLAGIAGTVNWMTLGVPKDPLTWDAVFAWIQKDWPKVPQMSTRDLAERMVAGSEGNNGTNASAHDKYQ